MVDNYDGDGNSGSDFAGTICSICYEDLKPITEDLQSITICGHVFHELCLQQWFEYCLKAKKHTCPVCKQSCKASDACRLYFQSVGEVSEAAILRKPLDSEEDPGVLRKEVKRLEVKVSGLDSELDRKGKEIEELTKELGACKEQSKVEVVLRNEALKQKASMQSQLRVKSEELEKTTFECYRLQERNMDLAKEIATLKLVSDLDLNEEDALRLATLGNRSNHKHTVDTLARSLVVRNREYRELISKCNLLGRVEDRYSKKLEKAKEKIVKLKARVEEMETAAEAREKQYLMVLKASKRKMCLNNLENCMNSDADVLKAGKISANEQSKQTAALKFETDLSVNNIESLQFFRTESCNSTENNVVYLSNGSKPTQSLDKEGNFISIDDDISELTKTVPGCSRNDHKNQLMDDAAVSKSSVVESVAEMQEKRNLAESSRIDVDIEMVNTISSDAIDEDVTILTNVKQVQSILNTRKESPLPNANTGEVCFSGGLLGPDGSNRYLGKWCKRGLNSELTSAKGSGNGDLIAVGADGRGGRIKVLRNPNQTFSNTKENSLSSKRLKTTPKTTSSVRPQGCLQIEHFFGRVTQ